MLAAQEFTLAASFRMHGDDEVVSPAQPRRHGRGEAGLHFDMDARIAGEEARQQRRHDTGAVIVHHAEPHHTFDLTLGQPADGFFVERENPLGVTEQSFACGAQIDIRLGPAEQLDAEAIFQPLDLHADSRLGPVQRDGRAGEGAVVGHGDERPQQFRIQARYGHNEMLFL